MWDGVGVQANGSQRVSCVTVLTDSLARTAPIYGRDLGLAGKAVSPGRIPFQVAGFAIDLAEPTEDWHEAAVRRDGHGLAEVTLAVDDIESASRAVGVASDSTWRIGIPGHRACCARLVLSKNESNPKKRLAAVR